MKWWWLVLIPMASAAPHEPLLLSGDICPHASVDCDHAGTREDPYILEGYEFNITLTQPGVSCDNDRTFALAVCGSTKWLLIRDVTITSAFSGLQTDSNVLIHADITASHTALDVDGAHAEAAVNVTQSFLLDPLGPTIHPPAIKAEGAFLVLSGTFVGPGGLGSQTDGIIFLEETDARVHNATIQSISGISANRGSLTVEDSDFLQAPGEARGGESGYRRLLAVQVTQGSLIVHNATFDGRGDAIDVQRSVARIEHSTFGGAEGTLAIGHIGSCTLTARFNDFGATTVGSSAGCLLDVRSNWWGTAEGPSAQDRSLANLATDPWLVQHPSTLPRIVAGPMPSGHDTLRFVGTTSGSTSWVEVLRGPDPYEGPWEQIDGPQWALDVPVAHLPLGPVQQIVRACSIDCGPIVTLHGMRTADPLGPVALLSVPAEAAPGPVLLDASNSYTDEGQIVSYRFTVQGTTHASTEPQWQWNATAGTHTIILEVIDESGRTATSQQTIRVEGPTNDAAGLGLIAIIFVLGVMARR